MSNIEAAFTTFMDHPTLEAAQHLEVLLDDAYPDDPLVQECVDILACYRPGGGEFVFNEQEIESHLQQLRAHLSAGAGKT